MGLGSGVPVPSVTGSPLIKKNDSLMRLVQERPAVIMANCADGDRAFLTVVVNRGATSSRDHTITTL